MLLVVDHDGSLGAGAVDLGDALEAGAGDDGEVFLEVGQLLSRGAAQQVVDEQSLGGQLADHAEALHILGVGACEAVEDEDFLVLQISDDLGIDGVEALLGDGLVDGTPGDLVVHAGGIDDELILGGAAGVLAGLDDQSAGVGEGALAAAKRMLGQGCGCQIAIDSAGVDDAQFFDAVGFHISSS